MSFSEFVAFSRKTNTKKETVTKAGYKKTIVRLNPYCKKLVPDENDDDDDAGEGTILTFFIFFDPNIYTLQ